MSDEILKKYATKFGFEIEADTEYKHVPFASYILKSYPTDSFVFKDEVLSLDVYKKDPKIRKEILYSIFNRSQFEKFPTILETDLGPDSQYTRTPSWIAEEVVETSLFTENFMKSSGSDILKTSMKFQIWFNLEFLEILRYKHDILGRKILFITDSLIKAKWAKTLYDAKK